MPKLQDENTSLRVLLLFIAIAYIFSFGARMFWIFYFQSDPQSFWNGELMINTNDGYAFAEGARDILAGHHEAGDLSWVDSAISKLTAFLATVLPISFEKLILLMPAIFGSLVVVPLILICRSLNQTTMGFIAALIGSVAHSYYNRTMSGYYDTDMLNIVFPMLVMYALVLALTHQRNRYLIWITLFVALYQWWYPSAYALDSALFVMMVGYALVFDRRNRFYYKIALFMLIGILSLPLWVKIALAGALFAFFHFRREDSQRLFWPLFGSFVALYFAFGGIDVIRGLLGTYVFREANEEIARTSLQFYSVTSTIREAGDIPFGVFADRISGHTVTFILACVGYLLALIAYRPLIVTLPLAGLGFVALFSGLRFTIYAVPVMAIGFAFLLLWTTQRIEKRWLRVLSLIVLTGAALIPNLMHIKEYLTPTVMAANEVRALDDLHKSARREDYVVTWWDYGYPIRYYSDVKTWSDGAKHSGDVNYPSSFVLTSSDPLSAAKMMRMYTEYIERGYDDKNRTAPTDFEYMMAKEGYSDPELFLTALSLPETATPSKTRDVYLYLPWRMMGILPTIKLFSNLDLESGKQLDSPFFYYTQQFRQEGGDLLFGSGIKWKMQENILQVGQNSTKIKNFFTVGYGSDGKTVVDRQLLDPSSQLSLVYMKNYGAFLLLDESYLGSLYIQMFVFEKYDPNLFEPVLIDPLTKIYKLKI